MDDRASRARVTGPLEPQADGFCAWLAGRGYAASSAAAQLHLMAHLSRWLVQEELTAGDLAPAVLDRFLAARRTAGYRRLLSVRATGPLAEYLTGTGLMAPAALEPEDAVLAGTGSTWWPNAGWPPRRSGITWRSPGCWRRRPARARNI